MSLRLYLTRHRKGYFTLAASLLFVLVYYLILFLLHTGGIAEYSWSRYFATLCKVVSFILINMGVYQLYNPTHTRHKVLLGFTLAVTFAVSLLHFFSGKWFDDTTGQLALLQDIGLELFLFVLIFLAFHFVTPYIGQTGKYQFALTVFFLSHISHLLNLYLFESSLGVLSFADTFLTVLFYYMLFFIQFDRVVELMQAIYNSSITDGLTGLYNRKFFNQRVAQYVARGLPVTVVFSDIDNFKKLNDTQGHQRGDTVLKQVADILLEESEEVGLAGRYGGEEMVVLITDPSTDGEQFAEKVRSRVEQEVGVTVSIGFSQARKGVNTETLVKQADEAMYEAKKSGKNRVVKYRRKKQVMQQVP
jgi:diguanylate cyclase (GGDEF)-like protein